MSNNQIELINCGSSKTPKIKSVLEELGFAVKETILLDLEQNFKPLSPVIISGAPILLTEIEFTSYLNKFKFIKETELPVLGICFGHQIIGLCYGAEVMRCEEARIDQEIGIMEAHPLFDQLKYPVIFNEDHCECISLPNNFKLLASSQICEVEAMIHNKKSIIGVQFHPETSEENGVQFFKNWLKIIT